MSYIKLDRKLLTWEWKDDPNMVALWIEILLQANRYENEWHGEVYEAGSFPTSVEKLSKGTGLTTRQIRTGLERLKKTKELTIESTNRGTKIIVNKYALYQGIEDDCDKLRDKQATNKRQTSDNTKRKKERKKVLRDIQEDIDGLREMGFEEEANKLDWYLKTQDMDFDDYKKIKDCVFDPNIRHIDQYVATILREKYES